MSVYYYFIPPVGCFFLLPFFCRLMIHFLTLFEMREALVVIGSVRIYSVSRIPATQKQKEKVIRRIQLEKLGIIRNSRRFYSGYTQPIFIEELLNRKEKKEEDRYTGVLLLLPGFPFNFCFFFLFSFYFFFTKARRDGGFFFIVVF